jgi:glycosyltransferase 2 family protein
MQPDRKTILRARILCVAVTLLALLFVLQRVQTKVLANLIQTLHPGWLLAGALLYGLLFLPAACRWHLALRANDSAVSLWTSLRVSLIGHFFYTLFFGAAGGDTTKSALYARWYRLPLSGILAASSQDRLLGCLGLILFASIAFAVAATHDGLSIFNHLSFRRPVLWLVAMGIVAAVLLIVLKNSAPKSTFHQFLKSFAHSSRRLIHSPTQLAGGILCGLGVQAALGGVLAICLQAVSHEPIPWLQLAWTFPVISVISALPITVAGLGVRDSAAIMLFRLYHVSAADAVAASLLTAFISLLWTIVGAALLWREVIRKEPEFAGAGFSAWMARLKTDTA